jgi:predicted DNA-binding transcriptional regulator YafY
MNANRSQFFRWSRILAALRAGRQVTARTLAEENGVSVRTIQRDLDALRDDHRARIEYDPAKHSLVLDEGDSPLLSFEITEVELFHLVVGAGMAAQFDGTPVAATLEHLFHKLQGVLDPPLELDPAVHRDWIRFQLGPVRPVREEVWTALVRGARRSRVVRLLYRAAGRDTAGWIEVEPAFLACRRGDWYLRARRVGREDERTYAVSRIQQAEVTDQLFERAPEPAEGRGEVFGRFQSDRGPIRVRMRFQPGAAEWIHERTWHPEQELREHRDGGVSLTVPIDGDREALSWVLRWGPHGRVTAPAWLKREALAAVTAMKEALEGGAA